MKLKKFNFNKVKSTNDTAIRLINRACQGGIVLAEIQSKGRGQRSNAWISKKGNLYISVFFEINTKISLKKIIKKNLTIIQNVLKKKLDFKTTIKKPNDILINKKKVCGILQEIIFKNNKRFLIVGIGINVDNSPNIINYETSYLNNYSQKKINKIQLFNEIKKNYENNLNYFKN